MANKTKTRTPNNPPTLCSAKEAATIAARYLNEMVNPATKPVIEEIESSEDGSFWLITLSYIVTDTGLLYQFGGSKEFKTFQVNRNNGEVVSMKIRTVK